MSVETEHEATLKVRPARRWRSLIPFNIALVLPAQLAIMAVVLVPTGIAVFLALTDWGPTQGVRWYDAEVIGYWNFYDLWYDDRFVNALWRTVFVVAVCVFIELVIAIGLALLFAEDFLFKKIAVSLVILPMMVVPVDAANAFFMLFNERGPINHIIGLIAGETIEYSWLSEPNLAMVPIMIAEIWQWTPLMFLLMLTGLMNLPENQVRAAMVLGATRVRIFFRVMLPLLVPVISVALLIRSIETFKIFDAVYILTRGGPGASTETISMFMYNGAFVYFRFGYIAAAAFIVLIVVLGICIALSRPLKRHG